MLWDETPAPLSSEVTLSGDLTFLPYLPAKAIGDLHGLLLVHGSELPLHVRTWQHQ